ncbi:MAG: 6-phosphofructokinase [Bacteroidetes bacterium]|nr:6-phosphofructokinase [Bacteroidota bacterium]MBL7105100.1 6-phosphofructokinase [Bacteroidales bacterium]
MKKIGVLTSGGDAPGMNACIRAIVRTGIYYGLKVYGVMDGYNGLIKNKFIPMGSSSVSNIIQRGGTILKTARSKEFFTKQGRQKAYENIIKHGLDGLVVIGGNGTFTGADVFINEFDFPIIGAPGTIDNDLYGTDLTIGYDTAINTVVEAVDKIRDTADSHDRLFFIEVMGRDAGFIALRSGIAVGAEDILVPETVTYIDELIEILERGFRKNKKSGIIIVAEGDDAGGAFDVARKVKEKFDYLETRVTILGHIQRGGSPSAYDRIIASTMGYAAVKALLEGRRGEMVGIINKDVAFTPFEKAIKHHKDIKRELLEMARVLSS